MSLWFVLAHAHTTPMTVDPREYHSVRWWHPDEIAQADPTLFDPHMARMLAKLAANGIVASAGSIGAGTPSSMEQT